MTCYNPVYAYVGPVLENGKINIVWKSADSFENEQLDLPCGNCIGCRLERSRQWAVRCMHEASLYEENCFITLTYADAYLPQNKTLKLEDFQNFMKRLRKQYGAGIRFFHCGEYGDEGKRPHYHALIFNFDFPDKVYFNTRNGYKTYTSFSLDKIWGKGFCEIGEVTTKSAAYVARYSLKKVSGPHSDRHYQGRKPEYITMSRRPGIGKGWYDSFKDDVYPSDEVIVNGRPQRVPRFYDNLLAIEDPNLLASLKSDRVNKSKKCSMFRLSVLEQCQIAGLKKLKRTLEK